MLKRVRCGIAAAMVLAFANGYASAQTAPAYNWTGFYAGANAGAAAGHVSAPASDSPATYPALFSMGPQSPIAVSSALGGVQGGYDYQWGPVVVGVETDFQYANGSGTALATLGTDPSNDVTTVTTHQRWFGTLRPRIGLAATNPTFFPYLTAGLAYASLNDSVTENRLSGGASTRTFAASGTQLGWVAGLGAEIPVSFVYGLPLVGGIEYLHTQYATLKASAPAQTINGTTYPSETVNFRNSADVFRIRVDYRF